MAEFDPRQAELFVAETWEAEILPALERYIEIPNKSPAFDPEWRSHGHMERAVSLIAEWCQRRPVPGLKLEVIRLGERTPIIWMEIPGTSDDTVLLYGHLDKQPEMEGWTDGLGPWQPVLRDDRLYGRGGADDGYAAFASLTAIEALARQSVGHARCVILIEACEESGSFDLPAYVHHLKGRIGDPSLVVCLDSGCGNYDQLWTTTSLRGIATGDLCVEILDEGVHSGDAGGVVPSSFRILRRLLSRLEDEESGAILPDAFQAGIPEDRRAQARRAAEVLGDRVAGKFPFVEGAGPGRDDPTELVLDRTWRPSLAVTGLEGAPPPRDAGNVLRPSTRAKLSLRLPPTTDAPRAAKQLKQLLEADPPYGARVRFGSDGGASGWNAPPFEPWLEAALDRASQTFFGRPAMCMGEGGSIPFMGMLGERFPRAQFLITGVLGPGSNAHGPNEFLHIPTGKRLTCCVAQILADHARR